MAVPTLVEQNRSEKKTWMLFWSRITLMLPTAVIMDDSPEARLLKLVKDLATKVEELKDEHARLP